MFYTKLDSALEEFPKISREIIKTRGFIMIIDQERKPAYLMLFHKKKQWTNYHLLSH
jgi:hypothetical protein